MGSIGSETNVILHGGTFKKIKNIKAGDVLFGGSTVKFVVCYNTTSSMMCDLGNGTFVTPWHPMISRYDDIHDWVYPCTKYKYTMMPVCKLYNLVLDKTHIITTEGLVEFISLAHGIKNAPILKHDYWGTDAVMRDFENCITYTPTGVEVNRVKFIRNPKTMDVVRQIFYPS